MVTLSPPTSEAGVRFTAWPQVGKLVVACRWSAFYSIEPLQNYILVSSALPTNHRDMTHMAFSVMSTIATDKDNDFCYYAYDVAP